MQANITIYNKITGDIIQNVSCPDNIVDIQLHAYNDDYDYINGYFNSDKYLIINKEPVIKSDYIEPSKIFGL